jgi:hypothetical protein
MADRFAELDAHNSWMARIAQASCVASAALAKKKEQFPLYVRSGISPASS